jgi:hypothetical protein
MSRVDQLLSGTILFILFPCLQAEGFSQAIIDRFFRPFLGGIFFDTQLTTSSRLFEFVMRMLATGSNCLPAGGIGAIAEQLASRIPADSIYTGDRAGSTAQTGVLHHCTAIKCTAGCTASHLGIHSQWHLWDCPSGQANATP